MVSCHSSIDCIVLIAAASFYIVAGFLFFSINFYQFLYCWVNWVKRVVKTDFWMYSRYRKRECKRGKHLNQFK